MDTGQNNWQQFLVQEGGELDAGRIVSFDGDRNTQPDSALKTLIIPLSHLGLLCASGGDTAQFLQGQTSNDVRLVDAEHHQLNSYNTPKGRMLALFTLFVRENSYCMLLPQERIEAVQKRLGMFILRSDVALEDYSDRLPAFALAGPEAETILSSELGTCPIEAGSSLTVDGITLLRRPGAIPAFVCIAEQGRLITLWQSLAPQVVKAGAGAWDLHEIRAGIPCISNETVEAFVPQMTNLQLIDGVNFKKGCYPGQEVVARMQYLGKLKRRMYRARVDTSTPPAAGTELFSPASASGQGAGKVVRAAPSPKGGYELLVVAEISIAETGTLFLQDESGPQLEMLELPYMFEQQ